MKKVIVSVLLGLGLSILSTAPSEATDLYTIDQEYLPKISLAESEHQAALAKWNEVDQVKLNNFRPFSWPYCGKATCDYPYSFAHSSGVYSGILKFQENPQAFMKLTELIDFDSCWAKNTWSCPQTGIYQLKDKGDRGPSWDFENMYGSSINWGSATAQFVAFRYSLVLPVKNDGSTVSFSEFETIRSLVKSTYANIQSLKNEYTKARSDYFAEVDWIKSANIRLSLNFPTTVKNNLIKQGYFKPLKPFYYTAKTGNYIVSATQITENTFTVKAGPEYKKYKYTYTKKEQADWMKESQKLLDVAVKEYNSIIETAKFNGYVVICKPNVPCQISL